VVHSFVVVCSLHVFSVVMSVDTSLCRISMIALADSNSSSTLFSRDSYALQFLQIYSLILSFVCNNTWSELFPFPMHSAIPLAHYTFILEFERLRLYNRLIFTQVI